VKPPLGSPRFWSFTKQADGPNLASTVQFMNTMFALFDVGGGQILLILALILIFFGAKKIPELAKGLGQGIKEFKKATREVTDEINHAAESKPSAPANTTPPQQIANSTSDKTVSQSAEPKG
jgi:sec-independent protein translocase protein TatA